MIEPCADRRDFRLAGPGDASAIAGLHAASWRRHYRGAYSHDFLDGELATDRLVLWTDRLGRADPGRCTLIAEAGGELIGFAHLVFAADPVWGALLENIHVHRAQQRSGVGSDLLAMAAKAVEAEPEQTGLHLWVLEQNGAAQAFYEARGARRVGKSPVPSPGGVPGRLAGSPARLRYAWKDPAMVGRP